MTSPMDDGPDAATIVWVHGAGMDRTVWMLAAREPRLAGFANLAIDLPGHGRSSGCGCGSIEDYARSVVHLLDERGLSTGRLVGHSMGALVVLEMLRLFPERVAAVVLAGATARMPVNPALIQAASDDLPKAGRMIATFAVAAGGRLAAPQTPGIRLGGGSAALLANSKPGVLAADLAACAAYESEVRPVSVPALVVSGALDRMVSPRRGQDLAITLGAKQAEIAGAGHMMMLEQPAAFADVIVPFLLADHARSRAR